jgi:hypothetical protein
VNALVEKANPTDNIQHRTPKKKVAKKLKIPRKGVVKAPDQMTRMQKRQVPVHAAQPAKKMKRHDTSAGRSLELIKVIEDGQNENKKTNIIVPETPYK